MLTLRLVCIGRMKAGAERDLCKRYLDRAKLAGRALGLGVELHELSECRAREVTARQRREADAIRASLSDKSSPYIAFDETGRSLASTEFAGIIQAALERGVGTMELVIGGPDGLDPSLRDGATHVLALGAMTWPHQLARIMVTEQVYRAITILGGHPYHRA